MKDLNKIEAYDVSHSYQDHAVASCIVYSKKGANKDKYRLFNIPKDLAGNDIGSLEHALERRLKYYENKEIKYEIIFISMPVYTSERINI